MGTGDSSSKGVLGAVRPFIFLLPRPVPKFRVETMKGQLTRTCLMDCQETDKRGQLSVPIQFLISLPSIIYERGQTL